MSGTVADKLVMLCAHRRSFEIHGANRRNVCSTAGEAVHAQRGIAHDLAQQSFTEIPHFVHRDGRAPAVTMFQHRMTLALPGWLEAVPPEYGDNLVGRKRWQSRTHTATRILSVLTSCGIGSPDSSRSSTWSRIASLISSRASASVSPSV